MILVDVFNNFLIMILVDVFNNFLIIILIIYRVQGRTLIFFFCCWVVVKGFPGVGVLLLVCWCLGLGSLGGWWAGLGFGGRPPPGFLT